MKFLYLFDLTPIYGMEYEKLRGFKRSVRKWFVLKISQDWYHLSRSVNTRG